MKLFDARSGVASAGTFSPSDFYVLPEDKKVFIDMITIGWETGTSGKASIYVVEAGQEIPIAEGYPLDASQPSLTVFPSLHLEKGLGIRAKIENAGAADTGRFTVWGVK